MGFEERLNNLGQFFWFALAACSNANASTSKEIFMPRTYAEADSDVIYLLKQRIRQYYSWIEEREVTFNLLMAHGPVNKEGKTIAPAIMLHGHQAAATVKINSLKDRVKGLADVTIEIDGDQWPTWCSEQRNTVLDHELYHLEKHDNADGSAEVDDCGRPRVTLRKHDFHFGGFAEIAVRHRGYAFEVKAVEEAYTLVVGLGGQLEWPWAVPRPNRKLEAS